MPLTSGGQSKSLLDQMQNDQKAQQIPTFDPTVFQEISPKAQTRRIPVIMYHDVVLKRDKNAVWFDTTVKELEEQFTFLEEHGYTPISLSDLHQHLLGLKEVPEKSIVLTFDDNYQGFYDNAYPLLRAKNYPSAMFVHTNFVGSKSGSHPKMSWETLKTLASEGLVTIGAHTQSHPENLKDLPMYRQRQEIAESKRILEEHLGVKVPYLAYPVGSNDDETQQIAKDCGITMAFTMENGPVEESPNILALNRWIQTKFAEALAQVEDPSRVPATFVEIPWQDTPVEFKEGRFDGIKLRLLIGGKVLSNRYRYGRQSVGEFVQQTQTLGGINGGFFAMAAIKGNDNTMVGPCLAINEGVFLPDLAKERIVKLINRPLVIWGPKSIQFVPFQPFTMNAESVFRSLMEDFTDLFVAGTWLVHAGQPRPEQDMRKYAPQDFNDPRKRAFFGVTKDGRPVLGATMRSASSVQLARAAAEAGCEEAILLDSGFSTSLVLMGKQLVSGHSTEETPSRPVPHALVLQGQFAGDLPEKFDSLPDMIPKPPKVETENPDDIWGTPN